ncbi:MAG TPA: hypothetical protein VFK20_08850, partial [Vicinamibacterales bacterium]|nr:hypothetical protein [Vicinamibacterales bacterium]
MPQTSRRGRPALTLPPVVEPAEALHTWRHLLLHSWAGRLFLISAGLKLLVGLLRATVGLPPGVSVLSSAATIGLIVSVGYFVWRLFLMIKRRLLWRVRRKLILSYIFIGVIPALLILVFFLFSGSLVFMNVSAYLFKDGYDGIVEDVRVSAQAAATEIGRMPSTAQQTLDRVHRIRQGKYPGISLSWIPPRGEPLTSGAWEHMRTPTALPTWMTEDAFAGTVVLPPADPAADAELIVRAAVK